MRYLYTVLYIVFIVLCNTAFTYVPNIVVRNLQFAPGDMVVGAVYVLRDLSQREIKHYVIFAMLLGSIVSYLLADKIIAVASVAAFSLGELIDWIIYTVTKRPLSQRILWSSLISIPVDTFVFLYLANMLHWLDFTLIMISKITGILILWFSWRVRQISPNLPLKREGFREEYID